MKKFLLLCIPLMCIFLSGCNNSEEPDYGNATGFLIVHLQQDDDDNVDFSEYSVAIVPESGFIPSAPVKEITWPVEVYVGTYTIAAASPVISETETTQTNYYGEVKNVKIRENQTTEVTVTLSLKEFPSNVW